MIKKTLYFGNPAYLSLHLGQLVIKLPEVEKSNMPQEVKSKTIRTIPIEDIGIVVLDNKQITITEGIISTLLENEVALITCNNTECQQVCCYRSWAIKFTMKSFVNK